MNQSSKASSPSKETDVIAVTTENQKNRAYISSSTTDSSRFSTYSGDKRTGFQVNLDDFFEPVTLSGSTSQKGESVHTYLFKLVFKMTDLSKYAQLEGKHLKVEIDTKARLLSENKQWNNLQYKTYLFENAKIDTSKPNIFLIGDNPLYLEVNDPYTEPGYTATDNMDTKVQEKVMADTNLDNHVLGTYQIIYNVKDLSGNEADPVTRSVIVRDTVEPVFNDEKSTDEIWRVGDTYNPLSGIHATDNYDNDITSKITYSGNVDTSKAGNYTINYTVIDSTGNITTHLRTVQVKSVPLLLNNTVLLPDVGTYSTPIALTKDSVFSYPVSPNPSYGSYNINAAISGAYSITTEGKDSDEMIFSGLNTYTGKTTVNNHLKIAQNTYGLFGSGAVVNNGIITFSNNLATTISNTISGTGMIKKIFTNSLTLSGNNSFTGGIILSGGTLNGTNTNSFGTGTITIDGPGGISLLRSGGNYVTPNDIIVTATTTGIPIIGSNSAGANTTFAGNITFNHSANLKDGTNDHTSFTGKITSHVAMHIQGKCITFDNPNNDTYNILVDAGSILQLNTSNSNSIPSGNVMTLSGTLLLIGGSNVHCPRLSGAGIVQTQADTGNASFTLDIGGGGAPITFNGTFLDNGTSVLSIIKNGTATQTLSGNSTYSGGTTINAGTLSITNVNALRTGPVTLNPGGTLALNGLMISNAFIMNGGTIIP